MEYKDPLKEKPEYFGLNGLRFLAAFWVLLFHVSIHFGKLPILAWIQPILDQGSLAMTLFFTLSGFILSYRYRNFQTSADRHAFWAARIARLYPVYLVIGLASAWLLFAPLDGYCIIDKLGTLGQGLLIAFAIPLFLFALQAWFPSLFPLWNFGGSWSLSVEAFFYTLFPWLRNRIERVSSPNLLRLILALICIVFSLVAGHLITMPEDRNTIILYYVLPLFRLPEFLIGICAYILFVQRGEFRSTLKMLALSLTPILLIAIYLPDVPGLIEWNWLAIIPFLAAFTFSIPLKSPQWMQEILNYLGRVSYCVYLAQFSTLPLIKVYKSQFSLEIAWLLAIGTSLALALLCYHLVEVLIYQRAKSFASKLFRTL